MSWLHRVLGKDTVTQLAVDSKHSAARVSQRPMEVGARGAYAAGFFTGVLPAALGANSEIYQFRWVNGGSLIAILRSIQISATVSTTFFAAGVPVQIEARAARGWSGVGSGGTGITFGANDSKKRTDFATSAFVANDMRIATTAALGAGTKTLDGLPFAAISAPGPITASLNGQIIAPGTVLWQRNGADEYPQLFENNEGFVIRSVAVPATGTWMVGLTVEWAEIDTALVDGWA